MCIRRLAATAGLLDGGGSPLKNPVSVDDPCKNKDLANNSKPSFVTLEAYSIDSEDSGIPKSSILYVEPMPLDWSFDIIHGEFSKFGPIMEIRNRLGKNHKFFETWIIYDNVKDAFRALKEFKSDCVNIHCSIVEDFPSNLDIYRHPDQTEDTQQCIEVQRSPDPPRWLIITTHGERGNLFKLKKCINQKLGHLKTPKITRFGRNNFLVHTNSDGQAAMLLNLKLDQNSLIKEVKPHYNFSYARGVIFNDDIYELTDQEILEMCPEKVWKVFKVPRSSMIILTFVNAELPFEIVIEKEIMRVRPYRPRVLQCFTCYGFGHASKVCTREKICQFCAQPDHGDCNNTKVCINCKGSHHARDKDCKAYKKEQEALMISFAEHISVGQAKKLLARRTFYSDKVKDPRPSSTSTCILNVVSSNADVGTSKASHVGASAMSSAGASQASTNKTPRASSGGASRASSGGASQASSGGAPRASSGGAPRASSGGAPEVPLVGTSRNTPSRIPRMSFKTLRDSSNIEIRSESRGCVGSGARSQSLRALDEFSLSGDTPVFESLPDPSEKSVVTIHRSNNGEEMEALSIRQKRARTPSSHSSSRSSSYGKNRNEIGRSDDQSSKTSSSERTGRRKDKNASGKISLSRPLSFNQVEPNKKVSKPE